MKNVDDWVKEKVQNSNNPILLKVTFSEEFQFRKSALKKLKLMNITHSTLFPDLSGASSHCNIVAEDYEA